MKPIILIVCTFILLGPDGKSQSVSPGNYDPSHKFLIGVYTGPGKLLQKAPADMGSGFENYFNKFRTGWKSGLSLGYFFNPYFGVQLDYTYFNTTEHDPGVPFDILIFGQTLTVNIDISSKIQTHELTPKVIGRLQFLNNRLCLTGGLGPSGIYYKSAAAAAYNALINLSESVSYHGYMPGISGDLGISYSILPSLSIQLQGKYLYVFLPANDTNSGDANQLIFNNLQENYKNISRFDGCIKLAYNFKFR